MQFHQGSRLKKFIEKSPLKVKEISEKSGVALSSLHDMYKKPELLWSKIEPILNVLNVGREDFFKDKFFKPLVVDEPQEIYGTNKIIAALESQNTALLDQVATLKKYIELLERKK